MPKPIAEPTMFEVCVCYVIRVGPTGPEVLLGRKKFGIGVGNLVGPGGKLEAGESPRDAIVREVLEETSLTVIHPILVGELNYPFAFKPVWSQKSWIFFCTEWTGTPRESDELAPEWFPIEKVPFDQMWDDAKYWLPALLAAFAATEHPDPDHGFLRATFEFGEDLTSVSASDHPSFRR